MDKNAWRKEFQERWALSNDTHDIRDSLDVRRLLENLEAAEQKVQEERQKSLGMANEINLAVKSYKEMEKRAAESEGHISALLEEMGNISTDEDGYQLCPWCTGRLNQKRTHQKNCPHQAAGGWLETHDSPK